MIKVGLTGGIGSGKTFVAKIFKTLEIPVYDSDTEAKKLYFRNDVRKKMTENFGNEVYLDNGQINKVYLSKIIFNDKNALKTVNSIIHPLVKEHFDNWVKQQDAPYIIKEAAILFESAAYKDMCKIISIIAPFELRIERVIKRDKTDKESIIKKINNQLPNEELIKRSDYYIINDEKKALLPQIIRIHQKLSGKSG